eukprot:1540830-Prymnesium_polylepis.1
MPGTIAGHREDRRREGRVVPVLQRHLERHGRRGFRKEIPLVILGRLEVQALAAQPTVGQADSAAARGEIQRLRLDAVVWLGAIGTVGADGRGGRDREPAGQRVVVVCQACAGGEISVGTRLRAWAHALRAWARSCERRAHSKLSPMMSCEEKPRA